MSIQFNDNFEILTNKPVDARYLASDGLPWTSAALVIANIPLSYRYIGLTVNINNEEYWFKDDISVTSDLIKKNVIKSSTVSMSNYGGVKLCAQYIDLYTSSSETYVNLTETGAIETSQMIMVIGTMTVTGTTQIFNFNISVRYAEISSSDVDVLLGYLNGFGNFYIRGQNDKLYFTYPAVPSNFNGGHISLSLTIYYSA